MNTKGLNGDRFVRLDVKNLEAAIAKCKNRSEFSKSLGHTDGFCAHLIKRQIIAKTDVLLIKAMYGIDVELKEPVKPEIEPTGDNETSSAGMDTLIRKVSANNVLAHKGLEEIQQLRNEIASLNARNKEISDSLHVIGNLLAQINEKAYKPK